MDAHDHMPVQSETVSSYIDQQGNIVKKVTTKTETFRVQVPFGGSNAQHASMHPSILIGSLIPNKQCVAVKDAEDGGYMIQKLEQVYYLMCQRDYDEHRHELVKTVISKEQRADFFQDVTFADGFDVMNYLDTAMPDREYTIESVDLLRTFGANYAPVAERAIGIIEAGHSVPILALLACKDPCKDPHSPDVWYTCNVSSLFFCDEDDDKDDKAKNKYAVNAIIKSGSVSLWSTQALVFHRLMNKASASATRSDMPDMYTYVTMSDDERKKYTGVLLELFTASYNAYQHDEQAKELKKLLDSQDKIIEMASKDSEFMQTKRGEKAIAKYDAQELCVKSIMRKQTGFPLMPFLWDGPSAVLPSFQRLSRLPVLPPLPVENAQNTKKELLAGTCVLDYYPNACDLSMNLRVLEYMHDVKDNDPAYKRSKHVYGSKQAGVYHLGRAFHYRNESFDDCRPIPEVVFGELEAVAAALTDERFDIVLFKVYEPGDSLANHQDIDGANLSVACFTFFTDASQACELDFCKYNGATTYSYRPQLSFRPDKCSMWFMSGTTNSQYSHRVRAAPAPSEGGLRVTVSFRQSKDLLSTMHTNLRCIDV